MKRILVIGYGNADRQDDGVAWHILVAIAQKLGLESPKEPGEVFESTKDGIDLIFNLQLFPELADTILEFDFVFFIDAHTGQIEEEIAFSEIKPKSMNSPFTHHLSPQMLLAITQTIFSKVPKAFLLSVRGYYFKFERSLSPQTEALKIQAADILWQKLSEIIG
ncbi:MAG: hypothetical protein MUO40_07090 [Anaerolineaceae bacterium]|nr:hypothetical protein [Anaerolineaceae bacterium]